MALADLINIANLGPVRPMPLALAGPVIPQGRPSGTNVTAVAPPLPKVPGPTDYLDSMVRLNAVMSENKLREQQGAYQKAQEELLRQQIQFGKDLPAMGKDLLNTPMDAGIGDQYNKVLDLTGQAPPTVPSKGTAAPSPEIDTITEGDTPEWRALAQSIAGPESGGKFNIMEGGKQFDSYAAHPNQTWTDANGVNHTSAGAWQITHPTWMSLPEAMRSDFEPETQYAGMKYIARRKYAANTGRDLEADLNAGRLDAVAQGLKGTWPTIDTAMKAYPVLYANYAATDPAQASQTTGIPAYRRMAPDWPAGSLGGIEQGGMAGAPGGAAPISQIDPEAVRRSMLAQRMAAGGSPIPPGYQPPPPGGVPGGTQLSAADAARINENVPVGTRLPAMPSNFVYGQGLGAPPGAGTVGAQGASPAAQAEQALVRLAQNGPSTALGAGGALPTPQQGQPLLPQTIPPPRPPQSIPSQMGAPQPGAVAPQMMPGSLAPPPRPMPQTAGVPMQQQGLPQAPLGSLAPGGLPAASAAMPGGPQLPPLPPGAIPSQYSLTPYEKKLLLFDMTSRGAGRGDWGAAFLSNYQNSPYLKAKQAQAEAWAKVHPELFTKWEGPMNLRPGSVVVNPATGQMSAQNPNITTGAQLQQGPGGQMSAVPLPGADALNKQAAIARATGPATFEPHTFQGPYGPVGQGTRAMLNTSIPPAPLVIPPSTPQGVAPAAGAPQRPESAVPTFPVQTPSGAKDVSALSVNDLFPGGHGIPQPPAPPAGMGYPPPSVAEVERQKKDQDRIEAYSKESAENQKIYQDLGHLRDVLGRGMTTSKLAPLWRDLGNIGQAFGQNINIGGVDPNDAAAFDKAATDLVFAAVKKLAGQVRVAEIIGYQQANPSTVIPAAANYSIINDILSSGKWQDTRAKLAQEYFTETRGAPLSAFEARFNEAVPLDAVTNHYKGILRGLGGKFPGDVEPEKKTSSQPSEIKPAQPAYPTTTLIPGGPIYHKRGERWFPGASPQ